jgi:hypothetical protein
MKKAQHRSEIEKAASQEDRLDSPESPNFSFVREALRMENFPFVVLLLLATISLMSRIWLMWR